MEELPACLRHLPGGEIYLTDGQRSFRLRVLVRLMSQGWTPEAFVKQSGFALETVQEALRFYREHREWFDQFFDSAGRLVAPAYGTLEYHHFIQARRRRQLLFGDQD